MAAESQTALTILKQHQLRVTPQRLVILTYLIEHHNHPTVETIRHEVRETLPNLGPATIYNTLNTLVDEHIVVELQNGDGSTHYDYFGNPHYHAICSRCGRIVDVSYPGFAEDEQEIEAKTAIETGYQIFGNHLEVYGLCPHCQSEVNLEKA